VTGVGFFAPAVLDVLENVLEPTEGGKTSWTLRRLLALELLPLAFDRELCFLSVLMEFVIFDSPAATS